MRFIGWFFLIILIAGIFGDSLLILITAAIAMGALWVVFSFLLDKTKLFQTDSTFNPEYKVHLKLDESKNPIRPAPDALAPRDISWGEVDAPTTLSQTEADWLSSRSRPSPQTYGVSAEGAERLVAEWLVYLGEKEVNSTQFRKDGGVDVVTRELSVQVKNYGKGSVSSAEANAIFGVATSDGKKACIFTSSSMSPDALKFAEKTGMIVISYDVEKASLKPLNQAGKRFLTAGKYESD